MSYVKTTWASGDVITADKLNNIEGGIEENSIAIGDTAELTEDDLVDAVNDLKEGKADADGVYEGMTVGNAEQLVSNVFITDEEPYFFRTSGGSNDIGDREYDELVGGTVAWNQYVADDHTHIQMTTALSWDTFTGSMFFSLTAGHKYLITLDGTTVEGGSIGLRDIDANIVVRPLQPSYSLIYAAQVNTNNTTFVQGNWDAGTTDAYFKWHDLTQMFGSIVADYIYTLESNNAGDGVAWFNKYFPNLDAEYTYVDSEDVSHTMKLRDYQLGILLSVGGVSKHIMTGFNQWDEEWENGYIQDSTGNNLTGNSWIRSKNYCAIFPNTTYYFCNKGTTANADLYFYDSDKTYLGRYTGGHQTLTGVNQTFTTPVNAYYMRFYMSDAYGTTYNHDICINLHWDGERDGEYEPYEEHSYPIDDSWVGMGIPKLDSSNKLYFDGDTYASDGTVMGRYATITFDGSDDEGWKIYGGARMYPNAIPNFVAPANGVIANIFTDKGFTVYDKSHLPSSAIDTYGVSASDATSSYMLFNFNTTDLATAKAWLSANPITVMYEVATPTTAEAEPFTNPQIVSDWGTEEYVTTGVVPVGHTTKYPANLKAKLEMAPNSPSGDGEYIVKQEDGENSYVPLIIPKELPDAPTTDGTYTLKCTVASGEATYSWGS